MLVIYLTIILCFLIKSVDEGGVGGCQPSSTCLSVELYFVIGHRMDNSQVSDLCHQLPNERVSIGKASPQWADSPSSA